MPKKGVPYPEGHGVNKQDWEEAPPVRRGTPAPKPRTDKSPSKFPPVPQKANS